VGDVELGEIEKDRNGNDNKSDARMQSWKENELEHMEEPWSALMDFTMRAEATWAHVLEQRGGWSGNDLMATSRSAFQINGVMRTTNKPWRCKT
jgi:hypothetical protein